MAPGSSCCKRLEAGQAAREGHRHHRLRIGRGRGRGAKGGRVRLPDQAGRPAAVPQRGGFGAGPRAGDAPGRARRHGRARRAATAPAPTPAAAASRAVTSGGPLAGDAAGALDGRAGGAQHGAGAGAGRVGHRQGTGGARHPRLLERSEAPFIAVNCGAIPEQLLEAEFFGYRKGSFTGANEDREGFVQAAQGGTLFLDEIGDLPLAMQSKLLRVIQERTVRPVGAVTETPINVRVVSATHKDLASRGARGALPAGPVLPPQRDPDPRAGAARAYRRPGGDLRSGAGPHRGRGRHLAAPQLSPQAHGATVGLRLPGQRA